MKIINTIQTNSGIFRIPKGGQLTLQAAGLENDDYVEIELVRTTVGGPPPGVCCTGPVNLAEIGWRQALKLPQCCGDEPQAVRLTVGQPFVVIDTPQLLELVAVKYAPDPNQVEVWLYETDSHGHNLLPFTATP